MGKRHRVLVTAHGHPDFSIGGAEVAACDLYNAYKANSLVEDAWFLTRVDQRRSVDGSLRQYRGNEYMWEQSIGDWHLMKAAHQDSLTTSFASFIHAIKPSTVHVHHYIHLGLEHLRVIKNIDPTINIIMTLHEFVAICKHDGQMIKKGTLSLCQAETYDACCRCFPEHTIEEFWLRKKFFLNHFNLVDQFVSPSEFLRQRYIQWGLPQEKIVVIENGHADSLTLPPRSLQEGETRNRFGFFGQINPYKGLDILLQALFDLPKSVRRKLVLEINGANLDGQSRKFRELVQNLSAPLEREGVIQWRGPYKRHELADRMATIDWVIVPSIWWENSPMVIQEAFVFGRPLLVSNIGGMAEKVRDGVNGLNVKVGDSAAWGTALIKAAHDLNLWAKLRAGITKPMTYSECADAHLRLIECRLNEKGLHEAHYTGAQYLH